MAASERGKQKARSSHASKRSEGEFESDTDPRHEGWESTDPIGLGAIPEIVRKALGLGFTGLFMTEGAIRKALGDTVPRDWIDFMVEQSDRTRAELLDRVSHQLGRSLEEIDLPELVTEVLEGRTVEIKTQIRLGPKPKKADDETEA